MRRYYLHRYALMVLAVLLGQGLETLEPYVLKRMINALSATVKTGASAAPVTTWFIVGFGIWAVSMLLMRGLPDRGYPHRPAAAGQRCRSRCSPI